MRINDKCCASSYLSVVSKQIVSNANTQRHTNKQGQSCACDQNRAEVQNLSLTGAEKCAAGVNGQASADRWLCDN